MFAFLSQARGDALEFAPDIVKAQHQPPSLLPRLVFRDQVEKTLHRLLRTPVRGRPRKFVAREPLFNSYFRFGSQK
jgi:hypothetical protein